MLIAYPAELSWCGSSSSSGEYSEMESLSDAESLELSQSESLLSISSA